MSLSAAFMGSPEFAVPSLRAVHATCDLRVVVCQPDRPAGRGRKLTPPAVKTVATSLGIPILQPTKMKDGTLAAALQAHDLDVIIVAAFGRILQQDLLALPRHGCINVHASVLPRWRGAAPIQRAVLAGDPQTGVSIMRMTAGLDEGPVFVKATTPIGPRETSGELSLRLAKLGAETLQSFLQVFPDVAEPVPQDHRLATHAPMLTKEEGLVSWARSPDAVCNHVRGMDPWPSAFCYRGKGRLRLFGAQPARGLDAGHKPPGTVLEHEGSTLAVACLGGAVWIDEVQPEGKRRMASSAYLAGKPFEPGEQLASSSEANGGHS